MPDLLRLPLEAVSDGELRLEGLRKSFGGIAAVDGLTCSIGPGAVTALIGPNGAGKTTIFNLIGGQLQADAGRVLLRGVELTNRPPEAVARLGVGRTFQDVRLFGRMSALENVLVAFPAQAGEAAPRSLLGGWQGGERRRREQALDLLEFVGLAAKRESLASELSYGQSKLLALARLFATGTSTWLLDEPTSGLDPLHFDLMMRLLASLPMDGRIVLLIEHNLDVIRRLTRRVLFLAEGRLLAEGTPDELLQDRHLAEVYFGT